MEKFKIGQKVKVVRGGQGVSGKLKGKVVTIINNTGTYLSGPGYIVNPKIGNNSTGHYKGFIGHDTFEAIKGDKSHLITDDYNIF